MLNKVRIQVFYSPSYPFSFREIEKIRKIIVIFNDKVNYEEIDIYENSKEAEKLGLYGLLSPLFIPVFINGERYDGSFNEEDISNAIRKALENKQS